MAQSKQLSSEKICHCRKCQEDKSCSNFYTATDTFLDSNGRMSVCKACVNDMYTNFYKNEQSLERTILRLCRLLNVKYDELAITSTKKHLQTMKDRGKVSHAIFGIYKTKLLSVIKASIKKRGDINPDLTFEEPNKKIIQSLPSQHIPDEEYYISIWGEGANFNSDDYLFLEKEFAKWKKTTECNTQGEELLVKELCYKQNEIRKARREGKSVDRLVKSLQEIMKNSALTPALQAAASSGRYAEAFGVWVKDIENLTPAEWYEDQELYHDCDGMEQDKKDILRSIKNFITGSRDFGSDDLEKISDIDIDDLEE